MSFREFELTQNRWVDAPDCQLIPLAQCDLTFDLGSDSDYNLRIRAQCGAQRSAWTDLQPPFNRRDSESVSASIRLITTCSRVLLL